MPKSYSQTPRHNTESYIIVCVARVSTTRHDGTKRTHAYCDVATDWEKTFTEKINKRQTARFWQFVTVRRALAFFSSIQTWRSTIYWYCFGKKNFGVFFRPKFSRCWQKQSHDASCHVAPRQTCTELQYFDTFCATFGIVHCDENRSLRERCHATRFNENESEKSAGRKSRGRESGRGNTNTVPRTGFFFFRFLFRSFVRARQPVLVLSREPFCFCLFFFRVHFFVQFWCASRTLGHFDRSRTSLNFKWRLTFVLPIARNVCAAKLFFILNVVLKLSNYPTGTCICMFCRASLLKMTKVLLAGYLAAPSWKGGTNSGLAWSIGSVAITSQKPRRKDGSAESMARNRSSRTGFYCVCLFVCVTLGKDRLRWHLYQLLVLGMTS